MNTLRHFCLILIAWHFAVPSAFAQPASFRYELLQLLPDDFAVCIVMNDLHGHASRWEKSDWLKRFQTSPIGKKVLEAPEVKQIEHGLSELKKHLDLDWPALRDDILADTLMLTYSPGPKNKPDDERGLFFLHVRNPVRLKRFIDKLNDAQTKSGELKNLAELQYKGQTYWRRSEAAKVNYYFLKDSLALFTSNEEMLRAVLDRRAAPPRETPWAKRFEKAGAEQAFITMCVNPRALDAELLPQGKNDDPLPGYWRALEAVFVTVTIRDAAEVRIAIQAKSDKLPKWASPAFTETMSASSLWQRFPERNVFTIASLTDFAGSVEALKLLTPEKDRKKLADDLGSRIQEYLQLDLLKDVLPNIGPDWGVCMLPAKDGQQFPPMIFALAVKPGSDKKPVDQALFNSVEALAKFAALQSADIKLQTMTQGKVEVKYLKSKTFLPGLEPAFALKDGFFLFATTPDAITEFRLRPTSVDEPKEAPLLRVSTQQLAKLLQQRREHIVSSLTDRQQMTAQEATQNLENLISLLSLCDRVTLSQHGDQGQASWIIRLTPK